jgi:GntR family transcriptional regulator, arabinose operon transcriptional repressor
VEVVRVMQRSLLRLDLQQKDASQPKHERLKNHFVNEMLAGRLKPGQALPSVPRLAETLRVAPMTIRQAMDALANDGLIRRVQGRGTFVEDDARRKLRRGLDIFALVVPDTRSGFYPSLRHGFHTAAGNIHYQAITCNTGDDIGRQANIILQLLAQKVGGVAITPTGRPLTPAFQVLPLQERGIPVVFCHRGVEGVTAPLLSLPFHESGRLAGLALASRGHRRVAFFTTEWSQSTPLYEAGLAEGLRAGGCDAPAESVYVGESAFPSEEAVLTALKQTFGKPDPPTGVFASFDSSAEMVYLLLPQLGLHVPQDISLVGEGGTCRESAITRRLTSVVVDEVAMGRRAVELLHEMRHGDRPIDDNEEFVLPLTLYEGETLAARIGACP